MARQECTNINVIIEFIYSSYFVYIYRITLPYTIRNAHMSNKLKTQKVKSKLRRYILKGQRTLNPQHISLMLVITPKLCKNKNRAMHVFFSNYRKLVLRV